MFEDKTYEALLQEKLNEVDAKYDKREGSIIFDALAPNSAEDAQVYIQMDWLYEQQHGETANRENLIKIAYDTRGIAPLEATYAELKGVFDADVPIGTRFSLDKLNYVVTELLDEATHTYRLQCETVGTIGNKYLGTLLAITYVENLTSAELTEVLVYARDDEDTEVFRQRWRESFHSKSFGGNKAEYKEEIKKIAGVGGVKVERATNAVGEKVGGYVRCTVISSDYTVPSAELINDIQTIVDPEVNQGDGDGLAPIGAVVNVYGVNGVTIDITATLTYDTGYTFGTVESLIGSAIDTYIKELCESWEEDSTGLIVRIARIESAILTVEGVLDIADTTLNGSTENVILDAYSIPVRGEISG